jgi:hypothetical protein
VGQRKGTKKKVEKMKNNEKRRHENELSEQKQH